VRLHEEQDPADSSTEEERAKQGYEGIETKPDKKRRCPDEGTGYRKLKEKTRWAFYNQDANMRGCPASSVRKKVKEKRNNHRTEGKKNLERG